MLLVTTSCSRSESTVNSHEEITTPAIVEETTQAEETSTIVTSTEPTEVTESAKTTENTTITSETTTVEEITTVATTSGTVPEWTENAINKTTMYVNTNGIYSRKKALQGSAAVKQYDLNTAVTVVALTDTDYYKLTDGTYIHKDYLSLAKVTVTTTAKPVTTTTTTTAYSFTYESKYTPLTEEEIEAMEREVFGLTNEFRIENGQSPLYWNETLHKVAEIRAKELIEKFSHERPDGSMVEELIIELGYENEFLQEGHENFVVGENIAAGQFSSKQVVQDWINSEGHRDTMLDRNDVQNISMAVGFAYGDNCYFWVQLFELKWN